MVEYVPHVLVRQLLRSRVDGLWELERGRFAWLHVPTGRVSLNGIRLDAGDGAAVLEGGELELIGEEPGDVLLFDLA